jgi:hypothetical protein
MASDRMIHQNLQSRGISVLALSSIWRGGRLEKLVSFATESDVIETEISAMVVKLDLLAAQLRS